MKSLSQIFSFPIRKIDTLLLKRQFHFFGKKSFILSPLRIQGGGYISIGEKVVIHEQAWLAALPLTGLESVSLKIKDGCILGDYNHIYATHSVVIEPNVLTANHVYISDNLHSFEDITQPIHRQPIKQLKDVVIGDGAWLGENVCVIGACVGKHSVVGANSVVTHDIPDFCVAVGAPAYIIKRYNHDTQKWEKTDKKGNFI